MLRKISEKLAAVFEMSIAIAPVNSRDELVARFYEPALQIAEECKDKKEFIAVVNESIYLLKKKFQNENTEPFDRMYYQLIIPIRDFIIKEKF